MPNYSFLLFRLPLRHAPCLRRERHAYFEQFATVGREWQGVFLAVDLVEGFLRGMVEFKLKDVDVLRCLYHGVHTTVRRGAFHLAVKAQQLEYQIKNILKIQLRLADYLITIVGKKGGKTFHKAVAITIINVLDEIGDVKFAVLVVRQIDIEDKFRQRLANFLVWHTESVAFEEFVVTLYRKVAALKQQRNLFSNGLSYSSTRITTSLPV